MAVRGVCWWPAPGVDPLRVRHLAEAALDAVARGAADRKESRRKAGYLLALERDEPDFLLKTHRYEDLPFWRRLRGSKSRAELTRAVALARSGIPVPAPVAIGERRERGLLQTCHALVPWAADAVDLQRARRDGFGTAAARRRVASSLGALVRRMHDAGVDQDDLAPNNFLWRPDGAPTLLAVDFERVRLRASVPDHARAAALAKLARHCADESAASRMRFLLAYTGGDRAEARRRWREVEAAAAALYLRDVRRWTRTATRAGRRFAPLDLDAAGERWRGWTRRSADRSKLCDALEGRTSDDVLRELGAPSRRDAALVWGTALALHQRALAPEPLALVCGPHRSVIVWTAPAGARPFGETVATQIALRVWASRLPLGLDLDPGARLDAFLGSAEGTRAWLVDPRAVVRARSATPVGARTRAARILELVR